MTLEATGGPAACVRCGRPAPESGGDGWGGRFHNGRLIAVACPACLEPGEREEIAARDGASLWEVVPARRAYPGALRAHAATAAERAWLAARPADAPLTGIATSEPADGALDVLWIGPGPAACRLRVPLARWAAFEEVYVPPRARELAARFA